MAAQLVKFALTGVEGMRVYAFALERGKYRVPAHERNLPLGGAAAQQHSHLSEFP